MWTDPVLSSAIMETMESTRRTVMCGCAWFYRAFAVQPLRHRVRGIGDDDAAGPSFDFACEWAFPIRVNGVLGVEMKTLPVNWLLLMGT